ncbi:protein of unknown function (plasmid) [Cupriavidus taiwanensis]|uniref:Uncharacterized protein n=1 Tax=Cupriavidus taiwanensis TaxID=164546 RepID=A0A9Q7XTT0_9BURK|nr:protein of unknown function [Cupriavidus taiwanensis]
MDGPPQDFDMAALALGAMARHQLLGDGNLPLGVGRLGADGVQACARSVGEREIRIGRDGGVERRCCVRPQGQQQVDAGPVPVRGDVRGRGELQTVPVFEARHKTIHSCEIKASGKRQLRVRGACRRIAMPTIKAEAVLAVFRLTVNLYRITAKGRAGP